MRSKILSEYPSLAAHTEVASAGTSAIEDNPATYSAIQAMDLWGIDLEPHRASALTASHLKWADLVLAMSRDHLLAIGRIYPQSLAKSTTLRYLAGLSDKICDRLGEGTVHSEREARSRIEAALSLLSELNQESDFLADIGSRGSDIIDPIGSSLQVYLQVAEDIDNSLEVVLRALFGCPEELPGQRGEH